MLGFILPTNVEKIMFFLIRKLKLPGAKAFKNLPEKPPRASFYKSRPCIKTTLVGSSV